ncbi:MAG: phosphoserine phosphatase SerB [Deltaproteobacteria bacterium]|nr:phosphoserine phosphatase SerB [Deltaproteobacteria bacterium]
MDRERLLVTVTGPDQPAITAELTSVLVAAGAPLLDLEQVVVYGELTLCLVIEAATPALVEALRTACAHRALALTAQAVSTGAADPRAVQLAVTVFGDRVDAAAIHGVARVLAEHGGNIERIHRLSDSDLSAIELIVSVPIGADDLDGRLHALRQHLLAAAGAIDIAVQRESQSRRAKRLVAMDMDSTLIQMEVIDELARRAGVGDRVAELTRRAMLGELDFEQSLRARVGLLAGLDAAHLDDIAAHLPLSEGAEVLVRVLARLGYRTAVISGGFEFAAHALQRRLGLDYAYANALEVVDGRVTGRVLEPVVTPARKAALLAEIAAREGIDLGQSIAIGDGANDLPMLEAAGLGIAFHAKPKLTAAADAAISHGSLTRVLYLLGLRARDLAELAP